MINFLLPPRTFLDSEQIVKHPLTIMSAVASSRIHVETKYLPPDQPYLPALSLQVTQLVSSYMVWIGATEESAENADLAPLRGFLLRDWACAMPPSENVSADTVHVYLTQGPSF